MPTDQTIWSVSALNFEIKTMLEKGIGSIWIEGEISNLARPASGHWYFSIKDERAQLRAAMFKNRNQRVNFSPENGQHVLIRAQVTLYEARGDFQVIVEHMEQAGLGLLMKQYEALKKQLEGEGLFAAQHKKPVPTEARHISIVTSASGAAIRDALSVIRRRSPSSEVTVFPTPVQGEQASIQIIRAIELANRFHQCDVLLLIRGGGSLEDLWCFNDEQLARAIFQSECPVVTGIGHEIDFTIADFVADLRAPTPSVAAESVTMDQYEFMSRFDLLNARLARRYLQLLQTKSQHLNALVQRLRLFHPQRQMQALEQRLNFALSRLHTLRSNSLQQHNARLQLLLEKMRQLNPAYSIARESARLDMMLHQLYFAMQQILQNSQHQISLQARSLDNLSPLKTLSRGYAALTHQGQVVSSVKQLSRGDDIDIRLKDGQKSARIR